MNRAEVRHRNLLYLLRKFDGSDRAFAQKVGLTPGYLYQVKLGKKGKGRNIGDQTAQKIEKALDLTPGWMDLPQWSGRVPLDTHMDQKILTSVIAAVDSFSETQRLKMSADRKAGFIIALYRHCIRYRLNADEELVSGLLAATLSGK